MDAVYWWRHLLARMAALRGTSFSLTGETVAYTAQAAELWITDGRSLTPAAEVLEHALQWWRKFFDEMSTS